MEYNILKELVGERERQDAKFGEQNYPTLDPKLIQRSPQRMCEEYEIPTEERAKQLVEIHAKRGDLTWMHILVEEVSEVASSMDDIDKLRKELIQVAAVSIAMIESIDKNSKTMNHDR